MYHFYVSVLLFIGFCELYTTNNVDAAVTTTSKKNGSTVVVTSRRTNKNTTVFIATRSDFDGEVTQQACQCAPFYVCDKDNSFQIPDNPKACSDTEVCCKIETPLVTTAGNSPASSCKCMPRSNCQISSDKKKGIGLIDPKFSSECENKDDICCPNEDQTTATPSQLQCGERRGVLDVRVTGTKDSTFTVFGEFPWMASIWKTTSNSEEEFICGASILSSNIVLTAAHCVYQKDTSALKIRAGDYDIKAQTSEEPVPIQERNVNTVIMHPHYDSQALMNDLAVIVTVEPFTFEQHIFPICTSLFGSEFADPQSYNSSKCLATGWGKSSADAKGKLSATLKKVELKIIPSDECQAKLRETRLTKYFELDSSFMCAGGVEGFDTCAGDGGGPLFCPMHNNRHQYVQVGVTSWGVGCGADIPGVYASLEANKSWLSEVCEKHKTSPEAWPEKIEAQEDQ